MAAAAEGRLPPGACHAAGHPWHAPAVPHGQPVGTRRQAPRQRAAPLDVRHRARLPVAVPPERRPPQAGGRGRPWGRRWVARRALPLCNRGCALPGG